MSWDVMAVCRCSHPAEAKPDKEGGLSVLASTLILSGVLVVCVIGWGLFLAKEVKSRRNKPKATEYSDVYAPKVPNISLHTYEELVARPSHVTDQTYADVGKRPSYLLVLP
jgi:hypothetical protein